MTLKKWLRDRRLRRHTAGAEEIAGLFSVVARDLSDSTITALSADRRFATAYNAALLLGTVVIRASGYRTSGAGHHWLAFQALLYLLGEGLRERVDYFDSCRQKRNIADYDCAGMVSEAEVAELIEEVHLFHKDVLAWLQKNHPDLL